jgi:peptidoglycan hydrolase-like protein with peptidoglycan-binding domain
MEQPEVLELQKILKTKYKANLGTFGDNKDGIDGIFGTMTENALMKAKGVKTITLKDL